MNDASNQPTPAAVAGDAPEDLAERVEALERAMKYYAEAAETIVSDVQEVEAILFNLERAFGLVLSGRDISDHVARMRERLARLQIFQPGRAPGVSD